MKTFLPIILVLVLAGCASPYRTVYTSAEGDSYIEELGQPAGYYHLYDSVLYAGIGFEPWWVIAYSPVSYVYYDPYYYLYYLSAWNPWAYQPPYGYVGLFGDAWCPPYRARHNYKPIDGTGVVGQGPEAPGIPSPVIVDRRDMWQTIKLQGQHKMKNYGGDVSHAGNAKYRSIAPARTAFPPTRGAPVLPGNMTHAAPGFRNSPSTSTFGAPSDFARSPGVRAPVSSGIGASGATPVRNKQ